MTFRLVSCDFLLIRKSLRLFFDVVSFSTSSSALQQLERVCWVCLRSKDRKLSGDSSTVTNTTRQYGYVYCLFFVRHKQSKGWSL